MIKSPRTLLAATALLAGTFLLGACSSDKVVKTTTTETTTAPVPVPTSSSSVTTTTTRDVK
ncbi:MAG: hypothetical protein JWL84_5318 [Rhodospirillales bacterium]|jgi:uncharacterized lipoprotein YajG|nr:hypothetical protein [Rhodospirillales bacterium]